MGRDGKGEKKWRKEGTDLDVSPDSSPNRGDERSTTIVSLCSKTSGSTNPRTFYDWINSGGWLVNQVRCGLKGCICIGEYYGRIVYHK
jgi:hypothetical protein